MKKFILNIAKRLAGPALTLNSQLFLPTPLIMEQNQYPTYDAAADEAKTSGNGVIFYLNNNYWVVWWKDRFSISTYKLKW